MWNIFKNITTLCISNKLNQAVKKDNMLRFIHESNMTRSLMVYLMSVITGSVAVFLSRNSRALSNRLYASSKWRCAIQTSKSSGTSMSHSGSSGSALESSASSNAVQSKLQAQSFYALLAGGYPCSSCSMKSSFVPNNL